MNELTPAEITERAPAAREVVEAIPIDVLRVIYDPEFAAELISRANDDRVLE